MATFNTPLNLAGMAVECYVAICLPLHHCRICTVRNTFILMSLIWFVSSLSIMPDFFLLLATEPLSFFTSKVLCARDFVFRSSYSLKKRDASHIVCLVLIFYSNPRYVLFIHLVMNDMLQLTLSTLLHIISFTLNTFSVSSCLLLLILAVMATFNTPLNLAGMAVECYVAICLPLHHCRICTVRNTFILMSLIWFVSSLSIMPDFFLLLATEPLSFFTSKSVVRQRLCVQEFVQFEEERCVAHRIIPRFVSPIVYGLRDQNFRKYMRRYLLCRVIMRKNHLENNAVSDMKPANVIVTVLCIAINYINGTLIHTFRKHQIFYSNPRYVLFIHLVMNDMLQLTLSTLLHIISFTLNTFSVSSCLLLLILAVMATFNTPLNLAGMAVECYVAICLPLHHCRICTVRNTFILMSLIWFVSSLSIMPDFFLLLATEPLSFFTSKVLCARDFVFRSSYSLKKRDASHIVCLVLIIPRFVSPIVYGLRDQNFRKYMRRYLLYRVIMRKKPPGEQRRNVIVTVLCIAINYINGTLIHTFRKHQIFYSNPRYVLFIHLVMNDMLQLTLSTLLHIISYTLNTFSVSSCLLLLILAVMATFNTPLNLAGMAVECYVAICLPLHHCRICTVRNTFILMSLIWFVSSLSIMPDFFLLLATEPLSFFTSKVLCARDFVFRSSYSLKKRDASHIVCLVLIIPRFVSPIVYGLRDQNFRKYMRRYLLCRVIMRKNHLENNAVSDMKPAIFYSNPRYVLFIHLVMNDMLQLTLSTLLHIISYTLNTFSVSSCLLLLILAVMATFNTPLNLAGMAVECYVAICLPLHHCRICTVRNTFILMSLIWFVSSLSIMPDFFLLLATEPLSFFTSKVLCARDFVFRSSYSLKKRDIIPRFVSPIVYGLRDQNFRKYMRRYLLCRVIMRKNHLENNASVIVTVLCIAINYINGTLIHTFRKHQIFYSNPRYVLFIHLVMNDMLQLTLSTLLHIISYTLNTFSVSSCLLLLILAVMATFNTPLNLAGMAVECYVAICLPLHHCRICTVRNTFILMSLIWFVSSLSIMPDFFLLLATEPLSFFTSKVLCARDFVFRSSYSLKKRDASHIVCLVLIIPRFVSPIVYGLRDQNFRKYMRRYLLCRVIMRKNHLENNANVIVTVLCIAINYINGTLIHTFRKHQIFYSNPRYVLFIHLVMNDMLQLTLSTLLHIISTP
ncbi:hypothetical protein F7725_016460 [Dissostichus mawsoni]|uniref:G-protein coupled receptors family 1 profile domain-containing protein n=1 Tax=Dissostichus mawsoni TaxID=36200 RepID=A0A7J5Z4L1_DISMA|nr:hypothetical protein F7725_016460 [Dissostichus mawsoni]